ncbi:similar to Saccharomyces cerevisiae YLR246W ERF2 Subunit of a palmitoyltransferase [Maudiozyma saulgeensis]|uniref:Palmitoyltransferase n=1 Tax=Maudiozyma saulgeensis TaxID=1789683 RepID=A0A1X7R5A9_9SACH|nr:similar to Saccharomyces cerevisiae YLR246W ERF2 Subunit of a palmitoyltransferase [Kazachstania saulgeensis]
MYIENDLHSQGRLSSLRLRLKLLLLWLVAIDGDEDILLKYKNYVPMSSMTNYIFFFGGRVRTLRGRRQLSLAVLFVIVVPVVLFSIFETNSIWSHGQGYKSLVVLFYYFWCLTLTMFLMAATSDPGCLPRNLHVPQVSRNYQIPQEYYNIVNLPSNQQSLPIQMKYCRSCRIWRPPRASHCSTCGCCVMVHDHHCVWINNCVGQRNYRFFVTFLVSAVITCIMLIANCGTHLHRTRNGSHGTPVSVLLIIWAGLSICYPATLLAYHIAMTGTQQTTREYLLQIGSKNPVMHRIRLNALNVYDTHDFFKNMFLLMAQVRGPKLMDPRESHPPGDWRFVKLP